jgi:hypothetical protein
VVEELVGKEKGARETAQVKKMGGRELGAVEEMLNKCL